MMLNGVGGLGMYPDETCFDPTRPSLLPYWLDDLTESQCKLNLLTAGNTTGNTAQAGDPNADPATLANAQAACASSGGKWDSDLDVCTPGLGSLMGYIPWIVGGLALVMIAPSILSRR